MKKIYNKKNVINTIEYLNRRYNNTLNSEFTIKQIIYAFNQLTGRYQDLLLKIDKDENDKAMLTYVYNEFRKHLVNAKEVPSDVKIIIKNIKDEEVKKKEENPDDFDIETSPFSERKKEELKTGVQLEKIKKEIEEIVSTPKVEEKPVKTSLDNNKELLNKRLEKVILEDYKEQRKQVDIEKLLDQLDLDDNEKYIILIKYDNNSVRTNKDVAAELQLTEDYIDEVVDTFFNKAIGLKERKIYSLERKNVNA